LFTTFLGVFQFFCSGDVGNCRLALKHSGAREVCGDVIRIHLWDGRYWLLRLHDRWLLNQWLLDLLWLLGLLRLNDCLLSACRSRCLLLHLRLKLLEQLLLLKELLLQQLLTGQ